MKWDENNVAHIVRHEVTPLEVESAVQGKTVMIPGRAVRSELRWKLFGKTPAGRYLVVVFTIRGNKFRTVTAHTMNESERRIYAPQID